MVHVGKDLRVDIGRAFLGRWKESLVQQRLGALFDSWRVKRVWSADICLLASL
jgi:hypothetical protein